MKSEKSHRAAKREKIQPLPLPNTFMSRHPFVATLLRGLVIEIILESLCRHSIIKTVLFAVGAPHIFLYNVAIIAATYSLMLLARRRGFVETVVSFVWLGLGLAEFIMMFFRKTPLSFIDLTLIPSVKSIVFYYLNTLAIIGIGVGVSAVLAWVVVRLIKCRRYVRKVKDMLCSLAWMLIVAAATVLLIRTHILPDHYDNLINAYAENGFAYCFTRSLVDRGIAEPEDYSADSVEEIMQSVVSPGKSAGKNTKPNIIMVQLESFFDPTHLEGIEMDEDPVPVFTSLRKNYPSGFLTVPTFGGGTVNTEFEILTGMSVRDFGTGEYPYHTVLREEPCESLCYNLREQGYSSHAIHNNTAVFYERWRVYANLGFDTFTSVEFMNGVEYNPIGWAKDKILTEYILKALKSTDTPDFVQVVSVQPHGSYPDDEEGEPIEIVSDSFDDEDFEKEFSYYVGQLTETDAFVGELINRLALIREPTIAVIYGDHLPNITVEDDMLDNGSIFQTEYAIWSNYKIHASDRDLNAWQMAAYVMGLAGYDNGILTQLHQHYFDNPNYAETLKMLEYDILYGEKSVYGGENPYEATQIRMGIDPISVESLRCGEKTMSVYGQNFTESSVVCVNGERKYTEFVSPDELIAVTGTVPGDEIRVEQLSSGETVSSTEPVFVPGNEEES